ncbi:hypothetical protein HU200_064012 [Digitaria exilis]|uniref:Uncharacterized protein n=1 Tax=Digitaria exilis TaxID=1010633 RepID=A0A835A2A5_9POAL|nr:hypothetical protein HU200_064012 [Digitaria exilis]
MRVLVELGTIESDTVHGGSATYKAEPKALQPRDYIGSKVRWTTEKAFGCKEISESSSAGSLAGSDSKGKERIDLSRIGWCYRRQRVGQTACGVMEDGVAKIAGSSEDGGSEVRSDSYKVNNSSPVYTEVRTRRIAGTPERPVLRIGEERLLRLNLVNKYRVSDVRNPTRPAVHTSRGPTGLVQLSSHNHMCDPPETFTGSPDMITDAPPQYATLVSPGSRQCAASPLRAWSPTTSPKDPPARRVHDERSAGTFPSTGLYTLSSPLKAQPAGRSDYVHSTAREEKLAKLSMAVIPRLVALVVALALLFFEGPAMAASGTITRESAQRLREVRTFLRRVNKAPHPPAHHTAARPARVPRQLAAAPSLPASVPGFTPDPTIDTGERELELASVVPGL